MKNIFKALALISALIVMGCVDNEESFYIEHAKAVPEDSTEFNTGDPFQSTFSINLFTTASPATAFLVTNALMKQQDQGTLKNESNGIMVDGFELYTLIPGQGAVGGTEYFRYNQYLAPDSSNLVMGDLMSSTVLETLRTSFGCVPYYSPDRIKQDIVYSDNPFNTTSYSTLTNGANGNLAGLPDTMTAVIKFLGHTQGGKNLETQEFSVRLLIYCGVSGGWDTCYGSGCTAICTSGAEMPSSDKGDLGLNKSFSCADYISQAGKDIKGTTSPVTGEFEPDINGLEVANYCEVMGCN